MGKIVTEKFPNLDEADREAVRQHAIAAFNLVQQAKQTVNETGGTYNLLPSPDMGEGPGVREEREAHATESDLLLRSLQRALNKDKTSRRITTTDFGPLFSHVEAEDDLPTGYIYVLRSKSEHPLIAENRSRIHKIGFTRGDVKSRIVNAKKDSTYLLAEVEIVATFKLANINGQKLEALLHRVFDNARLELALPDRFGIPVKPREWFLVPLDAIEAVIEKIKEGTIEQFRYDPKTASLTRS
jgi:T5orf172 domain